MRIAAPILAASLALLTVPACDKAPESGPSVSASPTVRLPAVPGRPSVAYLHLPVRGDRGALLSVTSPRVGRIEMHETVASGQMTGMRALERIPVTEGQGISFAPGGRHLMLFDLDPALRPGDTVRLTFHFERGQPENFDATVVAAGGGMGH